jgi:hypothetical protein
MKASIRLGCCLALLLGAPRVALAGDTPASVKSALLPLEEQDRQAAAVGADMKLVQREEARLQRLVQVVSAQLAINPKSLTLQKQLADAKARLLATQSTISSTAATLAGLEKDVQSLLVTQRANAAKRLAGTSPELLYAAETLCIDWAIEVRRRLRTTATEVPALQAETNCKTDAVRDRVLEAYCLAATSEDDADAEARLAVWQSQLRCLSARQVSQVEVATLAGWARTRDHWGLDKPATAKQSALLALFTEVAAPPLFLVAEQTRHFAKHPKWALGWFSQNRGLLQQKSAVVGSALNRLGLPIVDPISGQLGFVSSKCLLAPKSSNLFRGKQKEPLIKFSDGKGGETCNPLPALFASTGLPCASRDWVISSTRSDLAEGFTCAPGCAPSTGAVPSKVVVNAFALQRSGEYRFDALASVSPTYAAAPACDSSVSPWQKGAASLADDHGATLAGLARQCSQGPLTDHSVNDPKVAACLDQLAASQVTSYRGGPGGGGPTGPGCLAGETADDPQAPAPDPAQTQPDPPVPADPAAPVREVAKMDGYKPVDPVDGPLNNLERWERDIIGTDGTRTITDIVWINVENGRFFWMPFTDITIPGLVDAVTSDLANSSRPGGDPSAGQHLAKDCDTESMNCGSCSAFQDDTQQQLSCAGYDLSKLPDGPVAVPLRQQQSTPMPDVLDLYTHAETTANSCSSNPIEGLYCSGSTTVLCADGQPTCGCDDKALVPSPGPDCSLSQCGNAMLSSSLEGAGCRCGGSVDPSGGGAPPGPGPETPGAWRGTFPPNGN